MWDASWDVLTSRQYINTERSSWITSDIFDIRHDTKTLNNERKLDVVNQHKWAIWFDLYNKEFYEQMIPVHDDWHGYGPGDTYGMVISDFAKSKGADFQQYILEGQLIFEYPIGPLKERDFTKYYKYFLLKRLYTLH